MGATDPAERGRLRSELDGLIAHLYGLTEEEFAYILTTFPLVSQDVRDAAMAAYRQFTPKSAEQQAASIIAAGESATVEFKATARWNVKTNRQDADMERVILKTVAAFLNSGGGDLFIGVDDASRPIGLHNDYKTLGQRQNRDGFENWLISHILNNFGKDCAPLLALTFPKVDGHEICCAQVKPSPKACFVKEGNAENLFIRAGNSTRQLTTREAIDYCAQHWK